MVNLESYVHLVTPYLNRNAGPRYRCIQLVKWINKHLYNKQEKEVSGKVFIGLFPDACVNVNNELAWMSELEYVGSVDTYRITDETGCVSEFPEGSELLMSDANFNIRYERIENITENDNKVLTFYKTKTRKNNNRLKKITKLSELSESSVQTTMYDAMTTFGCILSKNDESLDVVGKFDDRNEQEIYHIKIISVENIGRKASFALTSVYEGCIIERIGKRPRNMSKSIDKKRGDKYLAHLRRNESVRLRLDKAEATIEKI